MYVYTYNVSLRQYVRLQSIPGPGASGSEFGYSISPAGDLSEPLDGRFADMDVRGPCVAVGAVNLSGYEGHGYIFAGGPSFTLLVQKPLAAPSQGNKARALNRVPDGATVYLWCSAEESYNLSGGYGVMLEDLANQNPPIFWPNTRVQMSGDIEGQSNPPEADHPNFIYFDVGSYPGPTRLHFQAGYEVVPGKLLMSDVVIRDLN